MDVVLRNMLKQSVDVHLYTDSNKTATRVVRLDPKGPAGKLPVDDDLLTPQVENLLNSGKLTKLPAA